jgi:hypothetical protein
LDWDINVEGSVKVLTDTATAAEPFDSLTTTYGEKLGTLMQGLNYEAFMYVAAAIGDYAEHWTPTLEAAATQVGASLTGAQNAILAYMEGQEQMAMNAQRNAANGYIPDPTSAMPTKGGDVAV